MNEQYHVDTGLDDQKGTELKVSLVVQPFLSLLVLLVASVLLVLADVRHLVRKRVGHLSPAGGAGDTLP